MTAYQVMMIAAAMIGCIATWRLAMRFKIGYQIVGVSFRLNYPIIL